MTRYHRIDPTEDMRRAVGLKPREFTRGEFTRYALPEPRPWLIGPAETPEEVATHLDFRVADVWHEPVRLICDNWCETGSRYRVGSRIFIYVARRDIFLEEAIG